MKLYSMPYKDYDYSCYPLSFFEELLQDKLKDDPKTTMELYGMKKDSSVERYCREVDDYIGKGDCGKHCAEYTPCNGKTGKCKYLEFGLNFDGSIYELSVKGLKKNLHEVVIAGVKYKKVTGNGIVKLATKEK